MRTFQVMLVLCVVVAYFLPWMVYVLEYEPLPAHLVGDPFLIPLRWEYASGWRVLKDLGRIARDQWEVKGGEIRQEGKVYVTHPFRGRAAWTAGMTAVMLGPLVLGGWALVRLMRSRRVGVWLGVALAVFGAGAFMLSGQRLVPIASNEWGVLAIIYRQGEFSSPTWWVEATLWGPVTCVAVCSALALSVVVEAFRRRRRGEAEEED